MMKAQLRVIQGESMDWIFGYVVEVAFFFSTHLLWTCNDSLVFLFSVGDMDVYRCGDLEQETDRGKK